MAKLAIRGHKTRDREVIKLLEMLGGKNDKNLMGGFLNSIYFINDYGYIETCSSMQHLNYLQLTLEEFEEKFPYKVGDKVCFADNPYHYLTIKKMWWNEDCSDLECTFNEDAIDVSMKDLQPYKEEVMEDTNEKSVNHVYDTEIISFDIAQKDKYELDLHGKFDVKLREGKYFVERIKPKYPKTYEECCEVLALTRAYQSVSGYRTELLEQFQELLICRDAYWKIAGKQMGLGQPWEPDWKNFDEIKYCIGTDRSVVGKCNKVTGNKIFAFPTEEMRDAFKENFDKDLEICKELL